LLNRIFDTNIKEKGGATMRKITMTLAAFFLMTGISVNAADKEPTLKESVTKVKKECRADVAKFCKKSPSEEAFAVSCLAKKRVDLTPACRDALSQTDAAASRAVDKADVEFRKSCGSDVQKFCAEVPSGRGRILDCLGENQDGLSKSCKGFQAKMQEKLEELQTAGA
jgi:hypothetical protein